MSKAIDVGISFQFGKYFPHTHKYIGMQIRLSCVYIITNPNNSVLYIGVTSNLLQRISDHKNKTYKGSFSAKYNLQKLVYFECFWFIEEAIEREKQMKNMSRNKKITLIENSNPLWKDLYDEIIN